MISYIKHYPCQAPASSNQMLHVSPACSKRTSLAQSNAPCLTYCISHHPIAMENEQPPCPYNPGNTITLRLDPPTHQTTQATITRVFEPFTLSSAMLVHISSDSQSQAPGFNGPVVLKLFDRRFAAQLRRDQRIDAWTVDIEREYRRLFGW